MQKLCSRCGLAKPISSFAQRAASKDGLAAACRECINASNRGSYRSNPVAKAQAIERTTRNRKLRFEQEPGYRRAHVLWGSTKRRTKIPPWVSINDFVSVCALADLLGEDFHVDHVIPLNHPLVCGLHVPENVRVMYGPLHLLLPDPPLDSL